LSGLTVRGLTFNNLSDRQFYFGSAVLLLIAFLYLLPVCFILRGNTDQGLMPLGAELILHGKLIYKDMWAIVLPGSYLWLALWLKLFGETWLAAKSLLLLTILAIVVLLLAISRRLIKSWLVFLPATILFVAGAPPWACNYHHWDSLCTVLGYTFLLIKVLDSKDSGRASLLAFLAGVVAGLSVCCMQSSGPSLLVGLAAAAYLYSELAIDKELKWKIFGRIFLSGAAGLALVLVSLLAYLIASGTLQDCINCTIIFNLHNYESVNREPYGSCNFFDQAVLATSWAPGREVLCIISWLIGGLAWWPFEIVKECPFWVAIGLLIYKLRRGSISQAVTDNPLIVLLIVIGFGYWLVELHRPDINRLLWGSQLLIIVLFYFVEYAYVHLARMRLTASLVSLATVFALIVNALLNLALYQSARVTIDTRWGKIATLDNLQIVEVVDKLTSPQEKVLVYPYESTVNFLTKTTFPSLQPWLQYHYNSKEQMESTIDDMEKSKVRYVVWDVSRGNQTFADLGYTSYVPVATNELIIEPYLLSHFDFVRQYGRFRLMKRKGATGQ
jgi:hypothetical protein